jgi:hypothetical protein
VVSYCLQLANLAVQIVDDLLRILGRRHLLPRANSSLARFINSCLQVLIIGG